MYLALESYKAISVCVFRGYSRFESSSACFFLTYLSAYSLLMVNLSSTSILDRVPRELANILIKAHPVILIVAHQNFAEGGPTIFPTQAVVARNWNYAYDKVKASLQKTKNDRKEWILFFITSFEAVFLKWRAPRAVKFSLSAHRLARATRKRCVRLKVSSKCFMYVFV